MDRYERVLGTGLIVGGALLLGIAFAFALGILTDPGARYDEWVPADDAIGPEARFEWSSEGLYVEFVDESTEGDASIERWAWDFGEVESGDTSPQFRFDDEGEWTVTLEVVDADGLTSTAEATVEVESGVSNRGSGEIGLSDLADRAVATIERTGKGALVVVLVIGVLIVLTMIGGRLVRQGVGALRPGPERVSVKLRPRRLELAMQQPPSSAEDETAAEERVTVGV